MRRRAVGVASAAVTLASVACAQRPAVLDAAGPQAARIESLWWVFAIVCAVVYALVLAAMAWSLARRRERSHEPPAPGALLPPVQRASDPALHRRLVIGVGAAVAATTAILLGFLGASVATGRALATFGPEELVVEITGMQWWWRITYPSVPASGTVETANEVHVPVGRTVRFDLSAGDVIHSLWVPRLHGKRDLVPGHATQIRVRADAPGTYVGQCAEFCGHQHANMHLLVVAEPPEDFERWLAAQRAMARAPATPDERRGQQVFLAQGCVLCHAIRGTDASGRTGPDLTHLASRRGIAANARPNTPGHLAAWILDPQRTKPGARMPAIPMTGDELQPLLAYLRSLP